MRSSSLHDKVNMTPVSFVRSGQIIIAALQRGGERVVPVHVPAIVCLSFVAVTEGVTVTEQFNPQRIKASIPTISEIGGCVRVVQLCQNRVGRIANDQKRLSIVV